MQMRRLDPVTTIQFWDLAIQPVVAPRYGANF